MTEHFRSSYINIHVNRLLVLKETSAKYNYWHIAYTYKFPLIMRNVSVSVQNMQLNIDENLINELKHGFYLSLVKGCDHYNNLRVLHKQINERRLEVVS